MTGLNVCADINIRSLFGRLVPLRLVGSPVVAIMHDNIEYMHVYISVDIGIGGENWLSQQRPTFGVERDRKTCRPFVRKQLFRSLTIQLCFTLLCIQGLHIHFAASFEWSQLERKQAKAYGQFLQSRGRKTMNGSEHLARDEADRPKSLQ